MRYTYEYENIIIHHYKLLNFNASAVGKKLGKDTSSITRVLKRRGYFVPKSGKGSEHSQWKGGRSKSSQNGYWTIYAPDHPRKKNNNRVFEHIIIAEKKYGKTIPKTEPIHHIDFDRGNNDPENLYLCKSHKEHRDLHCSLEEVARELFRQNKLGFKDGKYYWK